MSFFFYRALSGLRTVLTFALLSVPVFAYGGADSEGLALVQGLALAAGFAYLTESCFFVRHSTFRPFRSPSLIVVLSGFAMFVVFAAAQLIGRDAVFSGGLGTIAFGRTLDNVVQLACYGLAFLLFLRQFERHSSLNRAIFLLSVQAAALAVIGYYQKYVSPHPMRMYDRIDMSGYPAYFSSFLNSNYYGGYLVLVSALMTAWLMWYFGLSAVRRREGPALGQAIFFMCLLPFLTVSIFHAEARLAFGAQIVLLPLICLVLSASWGKIRIALLAAAGGAACLALLKVSQASWGISGTLPKMLHDWGGRLEIYRAAVEMLRDHPWFGIGLGACRYTLPLYQTWSPENITNIHLLSRHLELAVETGLIGYALFALPAAWLMIWGLTRCLWSESDDWAPFGWAAWLTLLSVAALSLPEEYLLIPSYTVVCLLWTAILVIASIHRGTDYVPIAKPPQWKLSVGRLSVWLAGAALIALAAAHARSDLWTWRLVTGPARDVSALERAASLRPWVPEVWMRLGELYREEALRMADEDREWQPTARRSVLAFERAVKLAPTWPEAWIQLGRSKVFNLHRRQGMTDIEQAARLTPYNRDYALYLALHYDKLADRTPWEDDRRLFRSRSLEWLSRCLRPGVFAEPLRKDNIRYLKNYSESLLTPEDTARIRNLIELVRPLGDTKSP